MVTWTDLKKKKKVLMVTAVTEVFAMLYLFGISCKSIFAIKCNKNKLSKDLEEMLTNCRYQRMSGSGGVKGKTE